MTRYYSLGMTDEDRWHLDLDQHFADGSPVDIWAYSRCEVIKHPKPVPFRIQVQGKRVDYNPTAFLVTVVSERMARVLEESAANDVQVIPAIVNGTTDRWNVINIITCVDCIDHHRSLIYYYPRDDHEKPGKPRGVLKLAVDAELIGDPQVLHPKDWVVATIVSEKVKMAVERIGASGIDFMLVT
jgi:hypothetical protein